MNWGKKIDLEVDDGLQNDKSAFTFVAKQTIFESNPVGTFLTAAVTIEVTTTKSMFFMYGLLISKAKRFHLKI